ncbi:MAG: class I SAM-dependent methyltransferase [Bacteriovoracaceae bacterium]|nr:class I SAM-dependent methyltransferase [Bacteriovoracaceae bacterium]
MIFKHEGTKYPFEQWLAIFGEENNYLAPFVSNVSDDFSFEIIDEKLCLGRKDFKPFRLEPEKLLNYHRNFFKGHSILKEPLAKAVGIKKVSEAPKVIDLTCGTMSDSMLFVSFGCEVMAFERNPIFAALITDALKHSSVEHFQFHFGQYSGGESGVLYFDPMYSHPNAKTAPKKEMALLREIISEDRDAQSFISQFLGKQRIVIKRPIKAEPLLAKPHHAISGKSTRYDVYLPA